MNHVTKRLRPFIARREPVIPTAGDGEVILPEEGGSAPVYDRPGDDADQYRKYQVGRALPYVGTTLFELGAGTGDLSAAIKARLGSRLGRLVLSDQDPEARRHLRTRFPNAEVVDFSLPGEVTISEPVDTVILANVLGHVYYGISAIEDIAKAVIPGGRIIIWEAADLELYSEFDRKTGRYQRYTPQELAGFLRDAGLEVEVSRYLNLLGGIFSRRMVGRTKDYADPRLVRLYDRLVIPISRLFDRLPLRFGQNVLVVARVPGTTGT